MTRPIAGIADGAGISIFTDPACRDGQMMAAAPERNARFARIDRAGVPIVAVERVVPAGSRGRVASVDRAGVVVLARRALDRRAGAGGPGRRRGATEQKARRQDE